jgi:hypothetical protein
MGEMLRGSLCCSLNPFRANKTIMAAVECSVRSATALPIAWHNATGWRRRVAAQFAGFSYLSDSVTLSTGADEGIGKG